MQKKNKKKLTLFLCIIMSLIIVFFIGVRETYAFNVNDWNPFEGGNVNNVNDGSILLNKANKVLGYIKMIGTIASVIFISILGIKYMLGSLEEKAEYKETLKPYVIGCLLIFGTVQILGIISNIVVKAMYG